MNIGALSQIQNTNVCRITRQCTMAIASVNFIAEEVELVLAHKGNYCLKLFLGMSKTKRVFRVGKQKYLHRNTLRLGICKAPFKTSLGDAERLWDSRNIIGLLNGNALHVSFARDKVAATAEIVVKSRIVRRRDQNALARVCQDIGHHIYSTCHARGNTNAIRVELLRLNDNGLHKTGHSFTYIRHSSHITIVGRELLMLQVLTKLGVSGAQLGRHDVFVYKLILCCGGNDPAIRVGLRVVHVGHSGHYLREVRDRRYSGVLATLADCRCHVAGGLLRHRRIP
mmetsp:Transcript_8636/g.17129  ORF Transcript_8636/g.17129 Transcript_8636/m.17129 type:complete len:283 (+) Transcript_8636:672-1520(+)